MKATPMLCADCAPTVDQEFVEGTNAYDERLLTRYMELRCDESFTELYELYFPVVFRHLRKFIPITKECEDLAQETFIMVSDPEAYVQYVRGRSVKNWIIGIADNIAMNAIRAASRQKRSGFGDGADQQLSVFMEETKTQCEPEDGSPDPIEGVALEDALEKVRHLVNQLDPEDRSLIEMSFFQDKTHRDIAKECNFASKTTATRRINVILGRLKESMLGFGDIDEETL